MQWLIMNFTHLDRNHEHSHGEDKYWDENEGDDKWGHCHEKFHKLDNA